ncbi:MAG: FliM/FliN family flagellar motor switch protein [Burkholderiaceae bacterium]|jgi:flagellar motor switch/type III secretory pathway protein FliN
MNSINSSEFPHEDAQSFNLKLLKHASLGNRDIFSKSYILKLGSGIKAAFGFSEPGISTNIALGNKLLTKTDFWIKCSSSNKTVIYVPASDDLYFAVSGVRPTRFFRRLSLDEFEAEIFNKLLLTHTKTLFDSFLLPKPVSVEFLSDCPHLDNIAIFVFENHGGDKIQGYTSVTDANQMLAAARRLDAEWTEKNRFFKKTIKYSFILNLNSVLLRNEDLEKLEIGSLVELQGKLETNQNNYMAYANENKNNLSISCIISFDEKSFPLIQLPNEVSVNNEIDSESLESTIKEKLVFEIGSVELNVADLSSLSPNEILTLNSSTLPHVKIKLQNKVIGHGELVFWRDSVAVQIIDLVNHE